MTKPKLQLEEKYSGNFELSEILMAILLPDKSKNNGNFPGIITPQQKGIKL